MFNVTLGRTVCVVADHRLAFHVQYESNLGRTVCVVADHRLAFHVHFR